MQAFQKKNGKLREMLADCCIDVAGIIALMARLSAADDSCMTSAADVSTGSTKNSVMHAVQLSPALFLLSET